ncbi:ATP-binding cassette sub-family C member 4-like [Sitodiplosis mosellana]|uniref:ATP-binding cassette sub-family C member 4-like n=1 Tax=Sitodiplosis mosellana TaxID=263140 RepID=UPI002444D1C6|nr:ATP-binding cassette sub-family C member 4-like [Sitodiplosis mosellana]XP_055303161.1 ATP-binding cassette sub-family C member 4-like [Sitodiplosis mosellana]XP_055303162.1 ATP-binding cassette sub-family C member 4-like [Sitodiplosis mosellana]
MDSSRKPEKSNPRKGANPLSQLFFLWVIPLFWKGTRKGLNTDDLTQCLEKDESESLGDELEREWEREVERASRRKRKPRLRNAMYRMFVPHFIVDGIECLAFILIRCILPLVLAQLLIQFQKPIVSENAVQNISNDSINDHSPNQFNTSVIERNIRSANNYLHLIQTRSIQSFYSKRIC